MKLLKLIGKKLGMTQKFDQSGNCHVCTVIEVKPHIITQIRKKETHGYEAIQLGAESMAALEDGKVQRKLGKPRHGFFKKANLAPHRCLMESRLDQTEGYEVGQEMKLDLFKDLPYVDVCGISKGKGYQGVMKLHGYSGIGRSHGAGPVHRHAGSTGMRSTPGRCLPGGPRASRMGADRVTVQSLKVMSVDVERNLLLVQGAVPGAVGSQVVVSPAQKKQTTKAKAGKKAA